MTSAIVMSQGQIMHRNCRRLPSARVLACVVGLVAAAGTRAAPLKPPLHADFGHYTFALTWQPGFCSTDGGCLSDQPHGVLIGLHGLWPSRPQSLIDRGVSAPQWWSHGCDYYHHSNLAPRLSPAMVTRLNRVMPHLRDSLLTHEYDKHIQCFGFDAPVFFETELRMRGRVRASTFGRYLVSTAQGHQVRHADVILAFMQAFDTHQLPALQLRCGRNHDGQVVLTQLWFTLHSDSTSRFPRDHSPRKPGRELQEQCKSPHPDRSFVEVFLAPASLVPPIQVRLVVVHRVFRSFGSVARSGSLFIRDPSLSNLTTSRQSRNAG
jgi:ribonuclease I (enterobacter ribonuclease)